MKRNIHGLKTDTWTAVNNERHCASFDFPQQAVFSIATDPFKRNSLDLLQYMHSGVGVFHPNGLASWDMIITVAHSSAQRNYILRRLHSNLILVSLDG